jgi:DNA repair protein RadA
MPKKQITIEDIPGVGEKIAEKLKEIGYTDPMVIAVTSPSELATIAEIGEGQAAKIVNAARGMLDIGFETADKILERKVSALKITTGSKNLDNLLGGGIETQAITETYAAFGGGKSQLAFQLSVNVQLPTDAGGLGRNCLFIDTENTFSPQRIVQMTRGLKLEPEKILRNIYVSRAFNSEHQMLLIEKAPEMVEEKNIGLIVVDSLTSHFRADYVGRGELAGRQQKLNRHLHQLQKLADAYNIAIYVTNQVMARPDILFGDPTAPVGGHILGHMCITPDTLIQLSNGGVIEARDFHNPLEASGINFETLKQDTGKCNGVFKTRNEKVVEINRSLKVSPEHTVFKVDGFDIMEIKSKYLKEGDYLVVPKKINIEGIRLELPSIDIEKVFIISKQGGDKIRKAAKQKKISLKKNNNHLFGITARQLRRVLNQGYPTKEENIKSIEKSLGIDLSHCIIEEETVKHKNVMIPRELTPSISQILGYFIGDGNLYENSIRLRDSRREVLEEYNKFFLEIFNLSGSITKIKNKHCFQLAINNKYIAELFRYLRNKYFIISKSEKGCVKTFLKGIFDAEGSISQNKLALSNKDKKLIEFCKMLLLRFGIHSKVNTQGNAFRLYIIRDADEFLGSIGLTAADKVSKLRKTSSKREVIPINREMLNKLFEKYGIKTRRDLKYVTREYLEKVCEKNSMLNNTLKKLLNSDISFEKITKIRFLDNSDELIDLSIPKTENFIANGYLVHNSTYRIYLRRGKEGTRIARMVDAPNLPEAEAVFIVTPEGIKDPPQK